MQLAALFGIGVLAAAAVYVFNLIALRRRHARLAAQMGCQPLRNGFSNDPSGMVPLFRGFKASRAKIFPSFVQENFERVSGEEGRAVGTVTMRVPFFRTVIFTTDPQNVQAILALKFKDFGFGVNRTENFKPLLGAGIVCTRR